MGVKMGFALDEAGHEWNAQTFTKGSETGNLLCRGCSVLVRHREAHSREMHGKPIGVSAYFYLTPNGSHQANCEYNVKEKIGILARKSKGLIEALEGEQPRIRLAMISKARASWEEIKPRGGGAKNQAVGKKYRTAKSKLAAYINTASRVAELRAQCHGNEEISEALKLKFQDMEIPWSEFYFETDQHLSAYNLMQKLNKPYPIAINGVVDTKRTVDLKYGPMQVINLQKPKYCKNPENPDDGIGIGISVWWKNQRWFSDIEEGSKVVIFGFWETKVTEMTTATNPEKYRFKTFSTLRLSTKLIFQSQMISIDD